MVVLNYNGNKYLENCLSSVLKTEYQDFEVVLVDNASTDDSLDNAEKLFGNDERLRIIRNYANLGFSHGNNVGFNHLAGDYIVFLNNDTVVDPFWLKHLVSVIEADNTIGLAQSMLLKIDREEILEAGYLFSDYLIFLYTLGNGKPSNVRFFLFLSRLLHLELQ